MMVLFSISDEIAVSVLLAFSSALRGRQRTATRIWFAELAAEAAADDDPVFGIADIDADRWTFDFVPALAKASRVDCVRAIAAGAGPSLSAISSLIKYVDLEMPHWEKLSIVFLLVE
jgi:hypothetical protein